jgi:hypothetical protein
MEFNGKSSAEAMAQVEFERCRDERRRRDDARKSKIDHAMWAQNFKRVAQEHSDAVLALGDASELAEARAIFSGDNVRLETLHDIAWACKFDEKMNRNVEQLERSGADMNARVEQCHRDVEQSVESQVAEQQRRRENEKLEAQRRELENVEWRRTPVDSPVFDADSSHDIADTSHGHYVFADNQWFLYHR